MQQQPMDPAAEQEQFQRVWERVQSGGEAPGEMQQSVVPALPAPPPPPAWSEEDFLRSAMDETEDRAALCAGWSQLSELRNRCRGQAKRLAGALYLLQGERYAPRRGEQPGRAGLAERCRRLYHACRRAAGRYEAASRRTEDGELRALFHELSGECALCAQQLRRMVERMM